MRVSMAAATLALVALAGCETVGPNTTLDGSTFDVSSLENMKAGIWVDPEGCDHWIIDDGLEGYMDARRDRAGRPVCRAGAVPSTSNVVRTIAGNK